MQLIETLIEPLGWTLLHFVWQGLLVGVLHETALLIAARRSPHCRYTVSLTALLSIIALPIVTFVTLSTGAPVAASAPGATHEVAIAASALLTTTQPALPHLLQAWLPYIVLAWLAGVVTLSLRFGIGLYALRRLAQNADYAAVSDWLNDELARLSVRMGIARKVRIALSTRVSSPLVVGWLKPVIFLPLSAATGLDHNQIRMVLAHELAHLRRHDHVVNFLQVVVETVLFYHPVVHRISRALREQREQCCDDTAAGISGDALEYARVLARLEEMRQRERAHVLALGIAEQELYVRIQRLVGAPTHNRQAHWLPVTLIGFAAILATARSPDFNAPLLPDFFAESSQRYRIALELPAITQREYRPISAGANENLPPQLRETEPTPASVTNSITDTPIANMMAKPKIVENSERVLAAEKIAVIETKESEPAEMVSKPSTTPVAIGGGELLHAEEPVYPRRALRYGEEGQVLLEFTITPQGSVSDAQVIEATPRGMFENAALQAIHGWRYQAFTEDGEPVARRARQLMEFRLGSERRRRSGTPASGECKEQTGTRLCRAPHSDETELRVLKDSPVH